jgi:hypothetical protein
MVIQSPFIGILGSCHRGSVEAAGTIRKVGDAGAAAVGPHDPVHGDAREDE